MGDCKHYNQGYCYYYSDSRTKDFCENICENNCGEELENGKQEETCGNPYSDLWVSLKYTLEGSEYCKEIREDDTAPAFNSALCNECLEKNCKFIDICAALYEMNREDHENDEIDNSDEEMDCLGCILNKENACADCCRDWYNEEDLDD
ncbi:hypothetical protein [Clostridium magnum]|uniref:Uncharacterized protein n=1 Tax=Clostridium magnum DSM 2767 TaxID=1121326 RepID=A0A162QLT5_9CLOT|nr:hypothetical protein [Clostridium magnum]KZL88687.1 hypothetical protein CLMAG_59760 [Clostridium magnum DSM 2767]SHJ64468.1 hypothetical protein SAMN02745944_06283 [Clostridium magnum DSM 2767]